MVSPSKRPAGEGGLQVEEAGVFSGYAALFGVPDLGNDILMPGAFAASLRRRGAGGIRLLYQHEPGEPIGRWLDIVEDGRGLKVRGQLMPELGRAREALAMLRAGVLDGLSIGFRTVRARREGRTGLRRIQEVDLWEISLVTFPMQEGARIDDVKRALSPHLLPARALSRLCAMRLRRQASRLRLEARKGR